VSLPSTLLRPIETSLAAAVTLLACGWALDVPRMLGVSFYPQQFYALVLALVLPLGFVILPVRRGAERRTVPVLDLVLAAAGAAAGLYLALRYPVLVNQVFMRPVALWAPGLVLLVLTLEALRRATGWALPLIVTAFLLYALFGNLFPGRFQARPQQWRMLSGYMAVDSNGMLGLPMSVAATIIVGFVLFGAVLNVTGGSRFFTDLALLGMGRFRGGSMKIAVLASGLFGSISGSAVANVVATGIVTIPMIKRDGYPAHKAGAIEAVASTGGQLMPPVMGAAAFLMAEFLQITYAEVALAALMPALLYYAALFIQADLEAARLGIGAAPASAMPPRGAVRSGLHFALAFAVLIGTLFWLNWQPEKAALVAAGCAALTALVLGYRSERPSIGALLAAVPDSGRQIVEIVLVSAAAGIVIGVLNVTGLSFNLTYALVAVGGGSAAALLALSALVCLVLGMGLPTLGVYVLLAALVAPAMAEVGIPPIAAHLYVLYFGMMSMITPPVALAAFAAASIAGASPMATGWAAVRFGWTAFVVPVLFVLSPSLLLIGAPGEIAVAVVTATFGVWLVSAAMAGYFAGPLSPAMRAGFAVAGALALVPAGAFEGAVWTDIAGVAFGLGLMAMDWRRAARRPAGARG
jgi:TRAP transporter 4TM/12TM fusion protein